ncbi:succinate--CoA ligase subunit alpha [Blattabacterium cuenoti]|uniref:succinate--CoA ligase subunit alpha n=1 Tax=Blattabacterium cuenoti TaxID=1653831 RepID=UPI00163C1712|nr:succinate--CoA ligase subunit alpha [Blattabacterium cuenoti]
MSILINKETRVIVQGLTGKEGLFHTEQMILYGTSIVGGVTPGKGGKTYLGIPIFNTMYEAVNHTGGETSIIFVPSSFASDAILESISMNMKVIVCITEGIPVSDMIRVKNFLKGKRSLLIGPNCPGVISSEESKVGILPNIVFSKKGEIGIISRSGTLTYEAAYQIIRQGFGISTAIGIGGDSIIGMNIVDLLNLFSNDLKTKCVVLIGEIGGRLEIDAAEWIKKSGFRKPIVGFIAGKTAPKGRTMGHAGAIIGNKLETAQVKMEIMKENGIHIVSSPANIGMKIKEVLQKNQ